ncbi:hypothetical protein Nepgr_013977 [Nepenthes gracilis]|uniref:Uncharacterized protein n=1 Tax=Nepenthes gracilis TaxID=150966 RepID=A0AAD3XPV7_NEPGR|nr:hypothetical protein Nepgr_013977 [Nepenthes gracilis]
MRMSKLLVSLERRRIQSLPKDEEKVYCLHIKKMKKQNLCPRHTVVQIVVVKESPFEEVVYIIKIIFLSISPSAAQRPYLHGCRTWND